MKELRFHAELYSGNAIDAATKVYADYATFDLEQQDDQYVVKLEATGEFTEDTIADELMNYALGATIESRREEG